MALYMCVKMSRGAVALQHFVTSLFISKQVLLALLMLVNNN